MGERPVPERKEEAFEKAEAAPEAKPEPGMGKPAEKARLPENKQAPAPEKKAKPPAEKVKEPPARKKVERPEKLAETGPQETPVERVEPAEKAEGPKIAEPPSRKGMEGPVPQEEPDFLKRISKEPVPVSPAPQKNDLKVPGKIEEPEPAPELPVPKKPDKPETVREPPAQKEERAEPPIPEAPVPEQKAPKAEDKPKERIKLGIVGTVKSIITREVEISEKDVGEMLDSLELELLEADVDLTVAEGIKAELGSRLLGAKVKKDDLHSYVSGAIRETLVGVLTNGKDFDIADRAEGSEKPLKVAFLGINGAGKTTTIAKVAKLLMGRRKKVVFAAADTFRAAAIEQMGVHGDRLGVKVIKRDYGSDPTSVAYDAVNYARAHGIDVVLIDTAGRQDTNISLINEMKKLDRVIKPDIKIYIGESIAGNAIIEQVSAFNREIGIDAVILTKLDCDPKGGTMLSISKATGIPIIYVGVGQGYDDLERFDPESIVRRILD